MDVAFVLYEDFTALDLIGPYEVISAWPDVKIHFLATGPGPIHTDRGLGMIPTATPQSLPRPDLILVPGSSKPLGPHADQALLQWLRDAVPHAQYATSVCTGSGVYAAAGLLQGRRATTHWAFRENLKAMGVEVVQERVVHDGTFISGAGVSAGIDMALSLTARVHGEDLAKGIQLGIEYDPQPPFGTITPGTADPHALRIALRALLGDTPGRTLLEYGRRMASDRLQQLRGGVTAAGR